MVVALLKLGARASFGILERKVVMGPIVALHQHQNIIYSNNNYKTEVPAIKYAAQLQVCSYSKKPAPQAKPVDSESDSDDEERCKDKKKRGDTEFWRRKMRTLHSLLDVNKDGVLSYDDFVLLTDKFSALGNLSPEATDEFRGIMRSTWEMQWGEVTPYNLVSVSQYLKCMHHIVNDSDLKSKCHRFLPFLFQAVDIDHSGLISLEEYKTFFHCLGLDDDDAEISFHLLDSNSDGQLSLQEFVRLGKDYFLTEDENHISRMFWGPLVQH